jgi:uncharacterized membrane protein YvlD (DUF360 family)
VVEGLDCKIAISKKFNLLENKARPEGPRFIWLAKLTSTVIIKYMIRNFVLNTLAVAIVFYILPTSVVGSSMVEKGINVIIISLLLSAVNLIIKPILKIITLPINIITFGLFSILINALMMWR